MTFSILMLLNLTFALGCVSRGQKRTATVDADPKTVEILDEALADLSNESYTAASHKLEQLIKENPVSEFDLVILYNSGVAMEGLKNCEVAKERYRSVARIANTRFDKIAALALYRLGFTYDCLGKPKESLVAFLDARKKAQFLPPDVAAAELPARIAAGYASLGRQKEALYYFNEASAGLKRILSRSGSSDQKLAATTMYAMGKLSETNYPLVFVRMLNMQQPFLLQSAELAAGESSRKAKAELKEAYHKIINQKFSSKKDEREFYLEGLKAARQLQKIRLPSARGITQDLFKLVAQAETTLQNRLIKLSETLKKTPQEEKRRALKKDLKVKEAE